MIYVIEYVITLLRKYIVLKKLMIKRFAILKRIFMILIKINLKLKRQKKTARDI